MRIPAATVLLLLTVMFAACSPWRVAPPSPSSPALSRPASLRPPLPAIPQQTRPLQRLGYTIQVGAFSRLDNAVRLERRLATLGIDAFYFRHESGLYKVRFGNHPGYRAAREEAERLRTEGLIDVFFIVAPGEHPAARAGGNGSELRDELVHTALGFLGVPYRWGGSDHDDGFDCSGLTMVCYRLNGLDLPRISRSQFAAGRDVPREQLRPGDLVFFATDRSREVSHVGLYIGDGRFVHAPRRGQKVQVEQLSHPFYTRTYAGGRSYL